MIKAWAELRLLSAAETRAERGGLQLTQLNYLAAGKRFQEAAELVPPDHDLVRAGYLNRAGGAFRDAGKYGQASDPLEAALAIREKYLDPGHPDVGTSLNNLAVLYFGQGRYAEAEPLFQRALKITEAALGPEHPDVGIRLNNLAELYRAQGRYAEAEPLYERSLAIWEKALGVDHPDIALSLNNLAGSTSPRVATRRRSRSLSGRWRSGRRCSARTTRMWPWA